MDELNKLIQPKITSVSLEKVEITYPPNNQVVNEMRALIDELPACHTTEDAEKVERKYKHLMFWLGTIQRIIELFPAEVTTEFELGKEGEWFFRRMGVEVSKLEKRTNLHKMLTIFKLASKKPY